MASRWVELPPAGIHLRFRPRGLAGAQRSRRIIPSMLHRVRGRISHPIAHWIRTRNGWKAGRGDGKLSWPRPN